MNAKEFIELTEKVAREIAASDGEDYMEDYCTYDRRARAAMNVMINYIYEKIKTA